MDDIKRPKYKRPQVGLPSRRRIDLRASVALRSIRARPAQTGTKKAAKKYRALRAEFGGWLRKRIFVNARLRGALLYLRRFLPSRRKHTALARVGWAALALLMFGSIFIDFFNSHQLEVSYSLSSKARTLLSIANPTFAESLKLDKKTRAYNYNLGYQPSGPAAAEPSIPKFTGSFSEASEQGSTVTDPVNNVSVTFKPRFGVAQPKKDLNRLIYPLKGRDAIKVYSLKSIGMKEDIILNSYQGDEVSFEYELQLPDGTEARLESNGALAIYGVQSELLGDVTTGTEKDVELLQKARKNAAKTTLLFTMPAPFVKEYGKKDTDTRAWFELKGKTLTLKASGLQRSVYPLSIDPTVYIESAAELMRGNNETNVDFDVDNQLIQKSQTTGARIDAWQGNLDMSEGIWDGGTAAAGGYVYRAGGRTGLDKPQIVDQQVSSIASNSTTFAMDMPATRPAGDLYVAMMCHDGTASPTAPSGGNWQLYSDDDEHAAYYKIGEDQGSGDESASYTWTIGSGEQWYGVIIRVTGFNAADPLSGTPGTSNTTGTPEQFPAVTPDNSAALVIRSIGADNDAPSDTGWVPAGHTKIASGNSNVDGSGSNDCGFVAASLDTPPISGVSTGTASLADQNLNGTYGAASIAINPDASIPPPQIEASQTTTSGDGLFTSFSMDMPTVRPAGDLYIAMLCHDDTVTPGIPSGWTQIADQDEFAAYYKVGTNVSGGNEAASYAWTLSPGEEWAGVIVRVSGFDSSDIFSGTPGTTNTSGTPGTFPATTPDTDNTLVIRAIGADNDDPGTGTAWVPSGHTKIASDTSSNTTNDCGFVATAMNNSPGSGVPTGTVNMGNSWLNDTYGGVTFAINAAPGSGFSETVQSSVNWAKFDSSTRAITSPNPGDGFCSGWCTSSLYDLPAGRRGHSMVAYNGYLYVMGGVDSAGSRVSTVYVSKLGANGEPQLWHPTDHDQNNWDYWYTTNLNGSTEKSYFGAVAYNNRMYILGGQTNAATTGVTTVEMADILPNGLFANWTTTGMQALPGGAGRYMHSVQVYNDVIYTIGGFEGAQTSSANMRNTVYYSKLNSDGTMNGWQATTTNIGSARATFGGTFSAVWGAYIYIGGGCTAVNGSGYCTAFASDMRLASINADGSLAEWNTMLGIENSRVGYTFIAWQGGLYRLGGCTEIDSSTGVCKSVFADVDYGVINPSGDASTVASSVASGVGTCTGGAPYGCNLPGSTGNLLANTAIMNGYLYIIGGCTNNGCTTTSANVAFQAIGADGSLQRPGTCTGTGAAYTDSYCVYSSGNRTISGGIAASGMAVYNSRIYVIGGLNGSGLKGSVYSVLVNNDGSLDATNGWQAQTFANIAATSVGYTYAYARANPASAGTYPGNLFIFGGCNSIGGPSCNGQTDAVYKCNILSSGLLEEANANDCDTANQLQIGTIAGASGTGLGAHSGTVYANYIYLIGGLAPSQSDLATVIYARFDNNNNVVTAGTGWRQATSQTSVGRRRGASFGYNGYIYVLGGYDATAGIIADIEFAKVNVSDGDLEEGFQVSGVSIDQRWGLTVSVSNSYAYVVGGCIAGNSPSGCTSRTDNIQTFQVYNNDSGVAAAFTAGNTLGADRIGGSTAVLNGYIYYAGGCTVIACGTLTDTVSYASIDPNGVVGSWSAGNVMPAGATGTRAWGKLVAAGGTLYYLGGQTGAATTTAIGSVVYSTSISSGNPTWSSSVATRGIGNTGGGDQARTQFGAAVWNNRIYVTGGFNASSAVQNTVYVSPDLTSGGNITGDWTSSTAFGVARAGHTLVAYANNLYLLGGFDGTNYLSDTQFVSLGYKTGTIGQSGTTVTGTGTAFTSSQIGSKVLYSDSSTATITAVASGTSLTVDADKPVASGSAYVILDGSLGAWAYSTSLTSPIRDGDGFAANGYIYLVGGRTAASTCAANIVLAPISANTTIATGNNPTGVGEWYETNVRYTGDRYGAAVSYSQGRMYLLGGGCSAMVGSGDRMYYSTLKSQPQVAKYSRLIDTDGDVFANSWLMNGIDNSIGARWQVRYRSMNDTDGIATDCGSADMTTWGVDTNYGDTILGDVAPYVPRDGSGVDTECARYYYFFVSIDASQTFGYPEDVHRGPTITDLSLFFTSDPSKRLRHGKTFTGGELQPFDTPCRQTNDPDCPLP